MRDIDTTTYYDVEVQLADDYLHPGPFTFAELVIYLAELDRYNLTAIPNGDSPGLWAGESIVITRRRNIKTRCDRCDEGFVHRAAAGQHDHWKHAVEHQPDRSVVHTNKGPM